MDLDALPASTTDNYRQAVAKTSGAFLVGESTALVKIGCRVWMPTRFSSRWFYRMAIRYVQTRPGIPRRISPRLCTRGDFMEFLRRDTSLDMDINRRSALNDAT